jgi:pyrroline-5-carboxylate reductase
MQAAWTDHVADPLLPGPLWFIGCGNMGGSMLEGWLGAGIDPGAVTVIRPSGRACGRGVRVLVDYPEDEVPAMVLLAMKPYQLEAVAPRLAPILDRATILVSILAGIEEASLRARFATPRVIARAMPNLPVRVGRGVVDLFSSSAGAGDRALLLGLMASLGHAEWFEEEDKFQIAGHLTGAGPAFLFRFIDALSAGAERLGLGYEQAARLAVKMVEGAGALAAQEPDDPESLAAQVASPGGTTQAGLAVLDADRALADLLERTLEASRLRALEMAAEARRQA